MLSVTMVSAAFALLVDVSPPPSNDGGSRRNGVDTAIAAAADFLRISLRPVIIRPDNRKNDDDGKEEEQPSPGIITLSSSSLSLSLSLLLVGGSEGNVAINHDVGVDLLELVVAPVAAVFPCPQ